MDRPYRCANAWRDLISRWRVLRTLYLFPQSPYVRLHQVAAPLLPIRPRLLHLDGEHCGHYSAYVDRDENKRFIDSLSRSQIYQDYERAFSKTTGLPLTLR